jgi:hypothetical protein
LIQCIYFIKEDAMPDETNMTEEMKWYYACRAEKAVASLRRNRMDAVFAPDRKEALAKVLELIPEDSVIGLADSITLDEIDLFDHLQSRKPKEIIRPMQWKEDGSHMYGGRDRVEMQLRVLTSDVYITGVNAVTLDGKLVSVDANGNRVAPMIFGPKRCIIVAGANKIVADAEAARERVRQISPINIRRHILKHKATPMEDLPCAKTGICSDCNSPARICNYTVIIESMGFNILGKGETKKVVIVGESLGI